MITKFFICPSDMSEELYILPPLLTGHPSYQSSKEYLFSNAEVSTDSDTSNLSSDEDDVCASGGGGVIPLSSSPPAPTDPMRPKTPHVPKYARLAYDNITSCEHRDCRTLAVALRYYANWFAQSREDIEIAMNFPLAHDWPDATVPVYQNLQNSLSCPVFDAMIESLPDKDANIALSALELLFLREENFRHEDRHEAIRYTKCRNSLELFRLIARFIRHADDY
jgi:hypothetical protein